MDLKLMNKYNKHPILNLGCGNAFGDVLVDLYHTPEVLKLDLEKRDYNLGKFKTIYCLGTIHYLKNQLNLLEEVNKYLEPDGTFILGTLKSKELALKWANKHDTPKIFNPFDEKILSLFFKSVKKKRFRFKWVYYICREPIIK